MTDQPEDPAFSPTQRYDNAAVQRARELLAAHPEQIGPYRIFERIGGGGMGEVFRAEQRTPIRREVAIKLIKLGMDTKAVIARFEAERQALALMDHPHIAKVFDAGTDDTGRPYFVMEYVKGKPITEYADQRKLSIAERVRLFAQVCHAVQHAHHKGVIHRDLKPSNVLVMTQDGQPFAKVIDFGLAKAIGQQLTEKTLFTLHDQFVGTPQYMSPEQAEGSLDIDTRTDVYSLGVTLYELLTGTPPFSAAEIKAAAFDRLRKLIIEVDPPSPSNRLSSNANSLPSLASTRSTEPKRLCSFIRGELDWIVMKALDKDRQRRYATPANLADDLNAHLTGEPILAAPPSVAYRFRKFLWKNKAAVLSTFTVCLILLVGIIGTTWGLIRATRAEQAISTQLQETERHRRLAVELAKKESEQSQRADSIASEERVARAKAERRLNQLKKTNDILTAIFRDLSPFSGERLGEYKSERPLNAILGDRLLDAAKALDGDATGDEVEVAKMQLRLATALRGLGYHKQALDLSLRAKEILAARLGAGDDETLYAFQSLYNTYLCLGDNTKAVDILQHVITLQKAKYGDNAPETLLSLNNLIAVYSRGSDLTLAIKMKEELLEIQREVLGASNASTLLSQYGLGNLYVRTGRVDDGVLLMESALRAMRGLEGEWHNALRLTGGLARTCFDAGQKAKAIKTYEKLVDEQRETLGASNTDTLQTMNDLASAYASTNDHESAVRLYSEVVALERAKFGPDHPRTLASMQSLANSYVRLGKFDLAIPLAEETLRLQKQRNGNEDAGTLNMMLSLSSVFHRASESVATPFFEELLKLQRKAKGASDPWSLVALENLAVTYARFGKHEQSVPLYEEALTLRKAKDGNVTPDVVLAMTNVASAYARVRRFDEAVALANNAAKEQEHTDGMKSPTALYSMKRVGDVLLDAGRVEDCVSLLDQLSLAHPEDSYLLTKLAAIRAWYGRLEGLQETCRRAEAIGDDSTDAVRLEHCAKICSFHANSDTEQVQHARTFAKRAIELEPMNRYVQYFHLALGMTEYRCGEDDEAMAAFAAAAPGRLNNQPLSLTAAFYRSMCLYRQGKVDEARSLATEASKLMKPLPEPGQNPLANNATHDDLIIWLTYKEAVKTIGLK